MRITLLTYVGMVFLMPFTVYGDGIQKEDVLIFSHQFHIEIMGKECLSCHPTIETSENAGDRNLPTHDECWTCHDGDTSSQDCAVCHVNEEEPELLPDVTRTIKFAHALHIGLENMDCQHCHQGVDQVDYAGPDQMPPMEQCMGCHDDAAAPRDCAVCHTESLQALVPTDHTFDWKYSHKSIARADNHSCLMCHTEVFCQDCHDAGAVEMRSRISDHHAPYQPEASHSKEGMVLKRVHDLNYRFTHGLDAKSKLSSCATCHDAGHFCTECHTEDTSLERIKPVWHGGTDWGAIVGAVGSGGGRHAEMARRDMALCVTCHDDQTDDPTCLMCHIDRLPGKGNDPRTHAANYYRDVDGPWHEDENHMCYNCHQSTRQPGLGFCGYCHTGTIR